MSEDSDYIVELSGQVPVAGPHIDVPQDCQSEDKRFVSVEFVCCNTFARVYINSDNSAYEGRCPKCLKPLKMLIGPDGTDCREFKAY